jgi:hypothetical protein
MYCYTRFSCIKFYERPNDCSQLESKHVAVNELIQPVMCVTDSTHTFVLVITNLTSHLAAYTCI